MIIFLAIMIGAGVLFGTGALVVDLGYGMAQQTVMQTSADAAALAAAKVLAVSVVNDSPVEYLADDEMVTTAANQFSAYNRSGGNASSLYATATEYLLWNGTECNTQPVVHVFAKDYEPDPAAHLRNVELAALYGTPSLLSTVPANTCAVRVYAKVIYNGMLGAPEPLGATRQSVLATGAARVLPADAPSAGTKTWPITHNNSIGAPCVYDRDEPCNFWSNTGGNFKHLLDFSHYSPIAAKDSKGCERSPGVFEKPCWNAQHMDDWDHDFPGANPSRPKSKWDDDWDNWFLFGFNGKLNVSDSDCKTMAPGANSATWNTTVCANSRVERYGGNHGSNIADNIEAFINGCTRGVGPNNPCDADTFPGNSLPAHSEGVDPVIGNYVTIQVYLWKYAEEKLNIDTDLGDKLTLGATGNTDRVVLDSARCFRFGDGTGTAEDVLNSSSVRGYFISCLGEESSGDGTPSTVANVVKLVN